MKILLHIQQKKNISSIEILSTKEKKKICNIGHKQDKYHDKADLISFLPKSIITSPKNKKKGILKNDNEKRGKEMFWLSVSQ